MDTDAGEKQNVPSGDGAVAPRRRTTPKRTRRSKRSRHYRNLSSMFWLFFRLPVLVQVLLLYAMIVLLTNHTALTDLINLIHALKL